MGLDVARIESTSFNTAPERAPRRSHAAGADDTVEVSSGDVPGSPPP